MTTSELFANLRAVKAQSAEQIQRERAAKYGMSLEAWERVVLAPIVSSVDDVPPVNNRAA